MKKKSVKNLTFFLIIFSLCTFYHQHALGFFDFESAQQKKWKKDVTEAILSTYECLIPAEERKNWKGLDDGFLIHERGGCHIWFPVGETEGKETESIVIVLKNNPIGNQKQYDNVDLLFKVYKSKYALSRSEWKFDKISDKEAIFERDTDNGKIKSINRCILLGNWLITLEYEYIPSNDRKKEFNWEQRCSMWLERIRNVHFE